MHQMHQTSMKQLVHTVHVAW